MEASDERLGVVFVHGLHSSPTVWEPFVQLIAKDPELAFVSPLLFTHDAGGLRLVRASPTMDAAADGLKEFLALEAEGIPHLVLVGHSLGGLVVQRYLARMLEEGRGQDLSRIRRIVLFAPPGRGSGLGLSRRHGLLRAHPGLRQLRPLDEQITETLRTATNRSPIPIAAYAGESDNIVSPASAISSFPQVGVLPGDHFTLVRPDSYRHPSYHALKRNILAARASGPPVVTAEMASAAELGVHAPAPVGDATRPDQALTSYVIRDHDTELRDVLRPTLAGGPSVLAVLTGDSATGKTRALYEALRELAPRRPMLLPASADELVTLMEDDRIVAGAVLWLDEAQRLLFGAAGEEAAAGLRALLERQPGVVAVGTLRTDYWIELTSPGQREAGGPHSQVRALLTGPLGRRIGVPSWWSQNDLGRLRSLAQQTGDLRLAHALDAGADDRRVVQYVSGGPEMLAAYGGGPGTFFTHAEHALITAALDGRRLGHRSPFPAALLRDAAEGVLDPRYRSPDPAWADHVLHALSTGKRADGTRTDISAGTALIARRPYSGVALRYEPADYLSLHTSTERANQLGSPSLWAALTTHTTDPDDLARLTDAAWNLGLYKQAAQLGRHAVLAGHSTAPSALVRRLSGALDPGHRAAEWTAAHADLTDPSGVAQLLDSLREAGADQAVDALYRRTRKHTHLLDSAVGDQRLDALGEADADQTVDVNHRPAAEAAAAPGHLHPYGLETDGRPAEPWAWSDIPVAGSAGTVFVSYAGPDRTWAEWVGWTLQAAGHRVELDLWDVDLGDNWAQRAEEGLERAAVVVALLSSSYFEPHRWTHDEWSGALQTTGRRLVPLVVGPLREESIPPILRPFPRIDISGLDEATASTRLLEAVSEPSLPNTLSAFTGLARTSTPGPRLPTHRDLPPVWNLSFHRPESTGRESLISRIRSDLLERGTALLQPLHGLDGVGNNEIAHEYAHRFASQYDIVWRVSAATVAHIRTGYTSLARNRSLPLRRVRTPQDVEEMFTHIRGLGRWLVIFADAGGPDVVGPWLPPGEGHVLIASDDPTWLEQDALTRPGETPRVSRAAGAAPQQPKPRVLAVATEWESGRGGLSTFNRQLCLALAAENAKVFCLVPEAGAEAREEARRSGVILLQAAKPPVWSEPDALYRKPALAPEDHPDIIIGHGRITGRAAQLLAEDHFPSAKRLHFIHVAPDELEWHRKGRADDAGERADAKTRIELALGSTAHRAIPVGPRLYQRYLTELQALEAPAPLRIDPGFDAVDRRDRKPPDGEPWKVLLFGRAEDDDIKGLDLAARALGLVAQRRRDATPVELVVRGAPSGTSENLWTALRGWAGNPSLDILVRPYATDPDLLAADLRAASLVIMPSRAEGFGLVGAEAITAGTPVLLSNASGLSALLKESLGRKKAAPFIVELSRDDDEDAKRWSQAVEAVLMDRDAAFRRADELRGHLVQAYTWKRAAETLLAEFG